MWTRQRILIGIVFFFWAFGLMIWNEAHSVFVSKSLDFVHGKIISVQDSPINPINDDKLIHFTGMTSSAELSDPIFKVQAQGLRLERKVEMYQYRMKYKDGTYGGEEWLDYPITSKYPAEDVGRPTWPFSSDQWHADKVKVGDYSLPIELINAMPSTPFLLDKKQLEQLQTTYHLPMHAIENDSIYAGNDPTKPTIGDMRITMKVISPQQVSILAMQKGNSLAPSPTPSGESIFLLYPGKLSAEEMLSKAYEENSNLAWLYRVMAFFLMFFSFKVYKTPIESIANFIPLMGRVLSFNFNLAVFIVTSILTTIIIAISWLAFRPLFSSIAILLAIFIVACFHYQSKTITKIK